MNINQKPCLSKIIVYPIKSLDGVSISLGTLLKSGALKQDRQWAIFDKNQSLINGKRNNKIYQLRATYDDSLSQVTLKYGDNNVSQTFDLTEQKKQIESFLNDYFGCFVYLKENRKTGFPDDTDASGPTIISQATLSTIAQWFPHLTVEEIRRRFRANLEINGVSAFWEDQLFANKNQWINFRIGDVNFQGINPCQRCIVPTKNSYTGEKTENFQQQFITKRKETLPPWVNRSQFNHFYRVSVNTKVTNLQQETHVKVGDEVKIIDN
ncbi:unknown [Crocosphaera subtropica ATCC 51142]|uniref:MOSC domain-containing protein n=1 Tax=Crocosphaera subtropica (strain ATCC 51142 / BH68) TaxID=43989 RepID=B1WZE6_CROS5|nr:MOSC N-terminal beta barrel domain-containing protein [Crocosphaera subtropica]ACB49512.1 unknown [Crocosphaera subtropica ATCC 51142]